MRFDGTHPPDIKSRFENSIEISRSGASCARTRLPSPQLPEHPAARNPLPTRPGTPYGSARRGDTEERWPAKANWPWHASTAPSTDRCESPRRSCPVRSGAPAGATETTQYPARTPTYRPRRNTLSKRFTRPDGRLSSTTRPGEPRGGQASFHVSQSTIQPRATVQVRLDQQMTAAPATVTRTRMSVPTTGPAPSLPPIASR